MVQLAVTGMFCYNKTLMKQAIRALLTVGSVWTLDENTPLIQDATLFKRYGRQAATQSPNILPYRGPDGKQTTSNEWTVTHSYYKDQHQEQVYAVLPKGTQVTVMTKVEDGYMRTGSALGMGVVANTNDPNYPQVFLHLSVIDTMTLVQAGKSNIKYYLRDQTTGHWVKTLLPYHLPDETLELVEKRSQAKAFKREDDVRLSALVAAGYYEGMPESNSMPYWFRSSRQVMNFQLPASLELIALDVATKNETVVSLQDIRDKMTTAWRLRELTVRFGSSVREAYKKMESKDQLGGYPFLVTFFPEDVHDYYGDPLTEQDVAEVKSLHKSLKKGETLYFKTPSNACIAFKSEAAASLFTAFYQGKLHTKTINLETLLEVVPSTQTVEAKAPETTPEVDLSDFSME